MGKLHHLFLYKHLFKTRFLDVLQLFQLTLMKGDKVVKLLQVIAQNSLLGYTWNSYNCVSHKFFIKIIYCAASSK